MKKRIGVVGAGAVGGAEQSGANADPHDRGRRQVVLIYDGDCPLCARYSHANRLRRDVGEWTLVNARERPDVVSALARKGFDLNEGFVLTVGNEIYGGADALHALALLSSRSSTFNRINFAIFRRRRVALLLYPVLRSFRNLLLWLLGRRKIAKS